MRFLSICFFVLLILSPEVGKAQVTKGQPDSATKTVSWSQTHDRVFLGGDVWANPMEDWSVVDGAAQCSSFGGNRNIQLLTHQLTNADGSFEMSVRISLLDIKKNKLGAGFKVGVRSDINEYRSNCFARNGIPAGIVDGKLMIAGKTKACDGLAKPKNMTVKLAGEPEANKYKLVLSAIDADGKELGSMSNLVDPQMMLGNVAIFNNFAKGGGRNNAQGSRYRFTDWKVSGDAFTVDESRKFGPILWTMYSLSDSRSDEGFVLKLSALTGPLGAKDNQVVELMAKQDGVWSKLDSTELDTDAWTATFRIPNWNEKIATPYKVVYNETHKDGTKSEHSWEGVIKANPSGRPLRLGALTCQKDYGFPYEPVCQNLLRLDPDMLYFSGDQLYEGHGGFGLIREPADRAILNYLRKYYMHGWAFRDAMKNAPTICLPDDHDVFQGNIWGEAGAAMPWKTKGASSIGGYREPARMVNAVHKTNCAHHPDYYDPKPVDQDISVYFGDMVYGGVSFAIIADRQWKSGPERVDTASGRADHVMDKNFDTSKLDKPGLVLLGERQEKFLKHWVNDWRGHSMKVLLSQTVFAGVATHHGKYDGYLKADLDSGAWPQTARNNAINIIRPGMPLHINGDQHLTSLVQYGVDKQRDGFWSFCTPAIAAGYPRWWHPERAGMEHENRPSHGLPHTGEFIDGFGNFVYVYAVGDPEVASKKNRYELAHQKGSGFGMVTIDTDKKNYLIESFKFQVDATDGKESNQFPGWPVTIQQKENSGDNVLENNSDAKESNTDADSTDSAPAVGISKEKPADGTRFVELPDGTFMVPYTSTLPGTDIEYSMVPIPGGQFRMGNDDGDDDEQPSFEVKVDPFWMSKYEVTWAEFHRYMEFEQGFKELASVRVLTEENKIDAVTAASPVYDTDHTYGDGEGPGEACATISQYGAKQYTKWLSLSTAGNHFYRLPMEFEWEYACRAGTTTRFYFGDDEDLLEEHANYEGQEDARADVGQRKPNPWGLYDMYGNVSEWVLDQYSEEGYQQAKDEVLNGAEAYVKPTELYPRIVRGGSFLQDAEECNSSARFPSEEDWRDQDPNDPRSPWWLTTDPATGVGFRIMRQYTPATRKEMETVWQVDHPQTKREVYGKVDLMQRGSQGFVDPKLHEDFSKIEN
jgi:formylglycine-generating enzyme required for sulfatase activity